MKVTIKHDFLIRHGFSEPVRWFDENWKQFRLSYTIEGFDCKIILSPLPQSVGESTPEEQVDEFSAIEFLKSHTISGWSVYVNSPDNHLATLDFQHELFLLMEVCKTPLKEKDLSLQEVSNEISKYLEI